MPTLEMSTKDFNSVLSSATTEEAMNYVIACLEKAKLTSFIKPAQDYRDNMIQVANLKSEQAWAGQSISDVPEVLKPLDFAQELLKAAPIQNIQLEFQVNDECRFLRGYTTQNGQPLTKDQETVLDNAFNEWLSKHNLQSEDGFISSTKNGKSAEPSDFIKLFTDEGKGFIAGLSKLSQKNDWEIKLLNSSSPHLLPENQEAQGPG